MIRNIVFDMGGVLIEWTPDLLMDKLGIDKEDKDIIRKELFKETEWIALDAGKIREEEAFDSVSKRVDARLHPYIDFLIRKWPELPFVEVEGIVDLIYELHDNGYKLYLLSNADLKQKDYFPKMRGYECFAGRVTSAEVKMLKPEEEIFRHLCDKYDLDPEECYFIDDMNSNVYHALKYGFEGSVFFDTKRLRKKMKEAGINVHE